MKEFARHPDRRCKESMSQRPYYKIADRQAKKVLKSYFRFSIEGSYFLYRRMIIHQALTLRNVLIIKSVKSVKIFICFILSNIYFNIVCVMGRKCKWKITMKK